MQVTSIARAKIEANPNQPRKHFDRDALEQLASSIATNGLLQPITVRPLDGRFQVVAGERRLRAIDSLGWETVPCIVQEVDDRQALILSAMENIARSDMNPMEEAAAMQALLDLGLTKAEVAEHLGTSAGMIQVKTSLLGCIDQVKHLVARGQFSATMAGQLSRLSANGQMMVLRQYQTKHYTQIEFTQMVNAIEAQENNLEMFPETKITREAEKATQAFRSHIDNLSRAAQAIEDTDMNEVGAVLGMQMGSLGLTIDEAIKVLQRAKAGILRQSGRKDAARLIETNGGAK